MTLDEKVGQLFILGFPQRELTPELRTFLAKQKPGAFVIFKRNFQNLESVSKLNRDLYALSMEQTHLPPLLAVDQEGGNVARIPTYPPMPSALSLGQTKSPILAEEMGYETAALMKELGFNMNLAPVLDIADPNEFSFIGTRSYGADPKTVGDMGYSFSRGLIRNGVVPTAKHFPGTGPSSSDPHKHSSVNNSSQAELDEKYLPPFAQFSKLGLFSAVMVSHSIYPQLDPQSQPAVFSKKIVTDILRTQLKFRGLAITDDLQMSASKALLKPEDAALAALQAGNDIVMLTWSFEEQARAIARVKRGVTEGELTAADLHEKLKRILTAKLYLKPASLRDPSSEKAKNILLSPKFGLIDDEILEKNIPSAEALAAFQNRICIFSASTAFLKSYRASDRKKSHTFLLGSETKPQDIITLAKESRCKSLLFVVGGNKTAKLLEKLPASLKTKTLVANMGSPSLVKLQKSYGMILNLYFPHQNAGKKIAQLLSQSYAILDF
jgi:beta-N-acetylhexosaminidase